MVQRKDEMKVGIVGLGFVGLVTAIALADKGNNVKCIDVDKEKIEKLKMDTLYIYEPGLRELFIRNKSRMTFITDYDKLQRNDVTFICVPTPTVTGKIDLSYVNEAVDSVVSSDQDTVIVIKSTVVPGTASGLSTKMNKDIISNPEFLREGTAINDTMQPNRIVIGGKNKNDVGLVEEVWRFTGAPVLKTTNENAELIKYASNAFLATKISFINEIANLCENIPGTDINTVAKGMGLDRRIGGEFLSAGIGYGGSCLPKDTKALVAFSKERNVKLRIISSAIKVNDERVDHVVRLIEKEMNGLGGKKICILGVSFKDNTNDIRESKALDMVRELERRKADVIAYDPVIRQVRGLNIVKDIQECSEASGIVIASEWKVFESNALYDKEKKVIDVKGIVDLKVHPKVRQIGMFYD